MTGIQLDRKDLEVLFQATLGTHLLLSLFMMLQVCHFDLLSFQLFPHDKLYFLAGFSFHYNNILIVNLSFFLDAG